MAKKKEDPAKMELVPVDVQTIRELATGELFTDFDEHAVIATAEKTARTLRTLRLISVSVTDAKDWTNHGGKPYLAETGVAKINPLWGVQYSENVTEEKIEHDDGHVTFNIRGVVHSTKFGHSLMVIGSRTSRDPFFCGKQGDRDWKEGDVRKAAYSNWEARATVRVCGLGNLRWEDIAHAVEWDVNDVPGVTYKKGGAGRGGGTRGAQRQSSSGGRSSSGSTSKSSTSRRAAPKKSEPKTNGGGSEPNGNGDPKKQELARARTWMGNAIKEMKGETEACRDYMRTITNEILGEPCASPSMLNLNEIERVAAKVKADHDAWASGADTVVNPEDGDEGFESEEIPVEDDKTEAQEF